MSEFILIDTDNVIFTSPTLVIDNKGRFLQSPGKHAWPKAEQRQTENYHERDRARLAISLRLEVAIPDPIWKPEPGVPIGGTKEEIEQRLAAAAQSLEFLPAIVVGKKYSVGEYLHPDNCECGFCPREIVYKNEDKIQPGFAPAPGIVPQSWFWEAPRDQLCIKVQSADGKWMFQGQVAGHSGSGNHCAVTLARKAGASKEVLDLLTRLEKEWGEECLKFRRREEEQMRRQLAAEYSIPYKEELYD